MAIKTISLETDAYDLLARARLSPKESFSAVVRRARWGEPQFTGQAIFTYMSERTRPRDMLTDKSIERLVAWTGRASSHKTFEPLGHKADTYLVDIGFLLMLETDARTHTEGAATAFLRANASAVFGISIITSAEFLAALIESDIALGSQLVGRFQRTAISDLIVQRYAIEAAWRRSATDHQTIGSNDLWVGCTGTVLGYPLLTNDSERFRTISGLRIISF